MWFDKDELRKAKDFTDPDINWMDFDLWKHVEQFQGGQIEHECPRCKEKMFTLNYAHTGVQVDYCAKCFGLWLVQGKFQCIIEALEQELLHKSLGEYVSATLQEAKELITGNESSISEWKDFTTILRLLQYRILANHPKLHAALTGVQRVNPLQ